MSLHVQLFIASNRFKASLCDVIFSVHLLNIMQLEYSGVKKSL